MTVTNTAREWVAIFEGLTRRNDLAFTTFLPFMGLVATKKLLRINRAWCIQCLDEWRRAEQVVYEPLLWRINTVTACPKHFCALSERCPHCGKENANFAARIVPGYCTACGRWLSDGIEGRVFSEHEYEIFSAKTIGEMIALAPNLKKWPTIENQMAFITYLREEKTRGGVRALARLLRVDHSYISGWNCGNYTMMLHNLAWVCFVFKIPMTDVVTLTFNKNNQVVETEYVQSKDSPVQPQKYVNWVSVETMMNNVLNGVTPSATVKDIAAEHGCHVSGLYRRFPDLCKKVSLKNFENLQQEIKSKYGDLYNEMKEYLQHCLRRETTPSKVEMYKLFGGRSLKRQALLGEIFDELGLSTYTAN